MGIENYSSESVENTQLFPELQSPSSVNDGLRQVQGDLASWYRDSAWVEHGNGNGLGTGQSSYTAEQLNGSSFRIVGSNVQSAYHPGRRVRISGTITELVFGVITTSNFSGSQTDIGVALDDAAVLASEPLRVWLGPPVVNPSWSPALLTGQPHDFNDAELRRPLVRDARATVVTTSPSSGIVAIDLSLGEIFKSTLDQSVTLSLTNWPVSGQGRGCVWVVSQDATGSRAIAWPGNFRWPGGTAPVLSTAANARDRFAFFSEDSGATVDAITIGKGFA